MSCSEICRIHRLTIGGTIRQYTFIEHDTLTIVSKGSAVPHPNLQIDDKTQRRAWPLSRMQTTLALLMPVQIFATPHTFAKCQYAMLYSPSAPNQTMQRYLFSAITTSIAVFCISPSVEKCEFSSARHFHGSMSHAKTGQCRNLTSQIHDPRQDYSFHALEEPHPQL